MFLHRVLPLPPASNILIPTGHHQPNVRRDSLQENRIMTVDQGHGFFEPRLQSDSPDSPLLPPTQDLAAVRSANEPTLYRSDGTQGSHRRNYSLSDVYQDTDTISPQQKAPPDPPEPEVGARPTVSPSQVCLCQPDPKVPRPRNAFILFRQHHQAEVAKNHPGLANPEISKIIGEYWRRSPAETKIRWKNLAEEEKVRHQKQYPDYRYQPRRPGRGSNANPSDTEPGKCPKCGGRSMNAPRLPSPVREGLVPSLQAATTPTQPSISNMAPEHHVSIRDTRPSPPLSGSGVHGGRMIPAPFARSPPPTMPSNRYVSRSGPPNSYIGSLTHGSGYTRAEPMSSPLFSPEMKRRRFEGNPSGYPAVSGGRSASMTVALSNPGYPHERHLSLAAGSGPRADARAATYSWANYPSSSQTAGVQPPPTPTSLAPIRTGGPTAHSTATGTGPHGPQARSIEAMIMSASPLGKVHTLAKIARPLPEPSPTSPPHTARGAIIAVEGVEDEILKSIITHLRTRLQANHEHQVRLFHGGSFASKHPQEQPTFADWLRVIQSWHREANDIRNFITTVPDSALASSPTSVDVKPNTPGRLSTEPEQMPEPPEGNVDRTSPVTTNDLGTKSAANAETVAREAAIGDGPRCEDVEMTNNASATPIHAPNVKKRKASEDVTSNPHSSSPASLISGMNARNPVPVAIIPRYQLTLTDAATSTIPIADNYSPGDHWSWVAATWRGVLGPDVTIIVRPHPSTPADESKSQAAGEGRSNKLPDVEVRLHDFRAIILRYESGQKIGESALRRVGFEVDEWLRSREERT